ncbi:aldo-keto reductase superfamily protein [Sugiyamaella lignohabitans]|uniref:Aldo-keto reductase superfamily protein n=1 Tax=Sugiyamaella lignohabitans TaxID=796027 RepID=A0A161HKN5_9ASCO|nr:aldo-keto reductase superfamily protein [Sugiyamaella lignohabitans]ANB12338.1 aldo-keto reductase superfamily protein [Sugiyamaella lignohabitans]
MSFGKSTWADWVIDDEEEIFAILKKAYDSGLRTWDTANVYSAGESEILIGKFLKKYNIPRSTVVILTKVFGFTNADPELPDSGPDDINRINRHGLSRKHIFDSVAASVKRLGTYIDVLQIHRCDKSTPYAETMEALHDVIKSGDVRYIGASSMFAYQFAQYQFAAERNGWTKFISMQNHYSAIYREEEREMIPYCKETGVGLIPWGPVAAGVLTRPHKDLAATARGKKEADSPQRRFGVSQADKTTIDRVEELAKKHNTSMATVATAWAIAKGTVPIVGFSKPSRIDDAIAALHLKLTDEEISYIDEPYEPKIIIGHQ